MPLNYRLVGHLSPEELEVEFLVRGLSGSTIESEVTLIDLLKREEKDSALIPQVSHIKEVPKDEILICRKKGDEFSALADNIDKNTPLADIEALLTKTQHYYDRAVRIKNTFGEVNNIISVCTLIKRVGQRICNVIEQLKAANTSATSDVNPVIDLENMDTTANEVSFSTPPRINVTTQPVNMVNSVNVSTIIGSITTSSVPIYSRSNFCSTQSSWSCFSSQAPSLPMRTVSFARPDNSNLNSEQSAMHMFNYPYPYPYPFPYYPIGFMQPEYNSEFPRPSASHSTSFSNPTPQRHFGNDFYPRPHMNRIPKWNISFDGINSKLDVHDFIRRLEITATNDYFPVDNLCRVIQHFVTGIAEKWLWTYFRLNQNPTWAELRAALLTRFTSHESERANRRFIEQKEQGAKESFNSYLLEMQTLNGHLSTPFSDDELLSIIRERMSPALQNATLTSNFDSLESLRVVCQRYERLWKLTNFDPRVGSSNIKSSSKPSVNEISRDCEIPLNFSSMLVENVESGENIMSEIAALNSRESRDRGERGLYPICWNCDDIGHKIDECKRPLKKYVCRQCGSKCPSCVKRYLENFRTNVGQAATRRLNPNLQQPANNNLSNNPQVNQSQEKTSLPQTN